MGSLLESVEGAGEGMRNSLMTVEAGERSSTPGGDAATGVTTRSGGGKLVVGELRPPSTGE